jgi:hypothetical protein
MKAGVQTPPVCMILINSRVMVRGKVLVLNSFKHYIMKAWENGCTAPPLLTSALDGDE